MHYIVRCECELELVPRMRVIYLSPFVWVTFESLLDENGEKGTTASIHDKASSGEETSVKLVVETRDIAGCISLPLTPAINEPLRSLEEKIPRTVLSANVKVFCVNTARRGPCVCDYSLQCSKLCDDPPI
jgi:hypothetical protein